MKRIILSLILVSSTVLYFGCNGTQSKKGEVATENHDGHDHSAEGHSHDSEAAHEGHEHAATEHEGHSHDVTMTATTASFVVHGNCGMCKTRIEETAMGIEGVEKAEWNKETKVLDLAYAENTVVKSIQEAIAEAGHDNGTFKADDKIYEALPGCCHYRESPKTH